MRSQFDIIDHATKAPNIFLVKVLSNGFFEYLLHGEEVIALVGKTNVGEIFSANCGDKDLKRFAAYLEEFCIGRKALHSYGTLDAHGKSFLKFESFDFPLVDEANNITHIIGILTLINSELDI